MRHVARLLPAERRNVGTWRGNPGVDVLLPAASGVGMVRQGRGQDHPRGRLRSAEGNRLPVRRRGRSRPRRADTDPARRSHPGCRRRLVARDPGWEAVRHRPARRDHHQRQRRHDGRLVLRETQSSIFTYSAVRRVLMSVVTNGSSTPFAASAAPSGLGITRLGRQHDVDAVGRRSTVDGSAARLALPPPCAKSQDVSTEERLSICSTSSRVTTSGRLSAKAASSSRRNGDDR